MKRGDAEVAVAEDETAAVVADEAARLRARPPPVADATVEAEGLLCDTLLQLPLRNGECGEAAPLTPRPPR